MEEKIVKIGIVGFGTVGSGVVKLIEKNAGSIAHKTGLRLEVASVVDVDITTDRGVVLPDGVLTDNLDDLINNPEISIGIELVGGTTVAYDIHAKLLQAGKDVVTANKALLAERGSELFKIAHENGRCIAFEASCAGGIPIISSLRTGLAANEINSIYGIVNGTCNYILSNMASQGREFQDMLKEAQEKGYAEADPTLDISGGDSAHKLAIMASIAIGCEITSDEVFVEGIEDISQDDIRYACEMGYVMKLLAIGRRLNDGKISLRVHPSFINKENALARVNGPFNAVSVFGDAVGQVTYCGRGAGMMATASAVAADVIDVALGNSANLFNNMKLKPKDEAAVMIDTIDNLESRFYIRIMCKNQPGVVAKWSKILSDNDISIAGAMQHEDIASDGTVPVVIVTHKTLQKNMSKALGELYSLDAIGARPVCIRIVDIPEDKD